MLCNKFQPVSGNSFLSGMDQGIFRQSQIEQPPPEAAFPRRRPPSPAGRKPSPTLKVDRAQPGPDEGKQPKSEKQATLNGRVFHLTWPVSLLGYGPSSVTPYGVPPSPEGKASSRRGILQPRRGTCGKISISLLARWVKEGHFHRKTPIFFEKNFLSVLAPGKMPKTWPICAKKRIGDRFPFEFHKIPPWGIGGEM